MDEYAQIMNALGNFQNMLASVFRRSRIISSGSGVPTITNTDQYYCVHHISRLANSVGIKIAIMENTRAELGEGALILNWTWYHPTTGAMVASSANLNIPAHVGLDPFIITHEITDTRTYEGWYLAFTITMANESETAYVLFVDTLLA